MTSQELIQQHKLLGLLIEKEAIVAPTRYNVDYDEEGAFYERSNTALPDYTSEELATEMNISKSELDYLLANLYNRKHVFNSSNNNDGYIPAPDALYIYNGKILLQEAHEIEELKLDKRWNRRTAVFTALIAIAAFLIPLIWTHVFQIAPLEKELLELKEQNKQLLIKLKHK